MPHGRAAAGAAARRAGRAGSGILVGREPLDRVAECFELSEQPQLGRLRILACAKEPEVDVEPLVAVGPEEPQLDPALAFRSS